jgi:hypothetical protein
MKNQIDRRNFVKSGTIAGCALLISGKLSAISGFSHLQNEIPDPKKLEYCGYSCPKNCQFLEASVKNDVELKRKAYETWEMKKRFGVDFDADKIFCFGCKNPEKPVGLRLQKCDVRQCAIENKLESCIECEELANCEKDLWTKFPEFRGAVIKMQKSYFEAKS